MARTACLCLALLALVACGREHRGDHGHFSFGGPVAYATTTVDCDGSKYQISTGTNGGKCSIQYGNDGKALGGSCQDGVSVTSVNCTVNGGKGGCGSESAGSASCTVPK